MTGAGRVDLHSTGMGVVEMTVYEALSLSVACATLLLLLLTYIKK